MLRSLFLSAVLLAATAPVFGDDPKPPAPATPLERIETLQKELNKKIADLQAEVAALKTQMAKVEAQSNLTLDTWAMQNSIESLQTEVNRLRDQLVQANNRSLSNSNVGPLREGYNRMPDARRDSNKIGEAPRESRRPALGYLRVVNDATSAHEVLLNGQRYFVGAFETVDLSVPAGQFSYQVLGRTGLRTFNVGANQTHTATILP